LAEQRRLAQSPGYLEAHLSVLRALVRPFGQREVLVERLSLLEVPTLVVWGARDRVFPSPSKRGGRPPPGGFARRDPDCGHMPHVECPDRFLAALDGFLVGQVHR
jgi:pimeloyl-ACP methyl ester carboxylesterase